MDQYFSGGSRLCCNDNWVQRKADNNVTGQYIKKVLKLPFNPSHFLDDKRSKTDNKQPSLAGAETIQVLQLSAQ